MNEKDEGNMEMRNMQMGKVWKLSTEKAQKFFSQLFPVIELRSSSLCADVMMEVIRREIRRCLKLCKLHNPEFFTPCFVPHFVAEYFGNILFKFAVASFDVHAINEVIP